MAEHCKSSWFVYLEKQVWLLYSCRIFLFAQRIGGEAPGTCARSKMSIFPFHSSTHSKNPQGASQRAVRYCRAWERGEGWVLLFVHSSKWNRNCKMLWICAGSDSDIEWEGVLLITITIINSSPLRSVGGYSLWVRGRLLSVVAFSACNLTHSMKTSACNWFLIRQLLLIISRFL